jgi:hypothetical protein
MLSSRLLAFIWSSNFGDAVWGLVAIAVIIFLVVVWYVREGRNRVLEDLVVITDFGPPASFRGSLTVEDYKPQKSLRLSTTTTTSRRLQFWYRWIVGKGPQATFTEVTFDGLQGSIKLTKKNELTTALFSEFSPVRMREIANGKYGGALWHIELVRLNGKALPFVTSASGDRRTMFERTASVAKAVWAIMSIPVHVFVAGNIWTPGWPHRPLH